MRRDYWMLGLKGDGVANDSRRMLTRVLKSLSLNADLYPPHGRLSRSSLSSLQSALTSVYSTAFC